MKLTPYRIVLVEEFEVGDFLCHHTNWDYASEHDISPMFFTATREDVDTYSGNNGEYYKIVSNNK
jgi:hypothetical protein